MDNVVFMNGLKSAQFPSPLSVWCPQNFANSKKSVSICRLFKKCTTKQSVNLVFTQCHKLLVWGGGGKLGGGGGVMWRCVDSVFY